LAGLERIKNALGREGGNGYCESGEFVGAYVGDCIWIRFIAFVFAAGNNKQNQKGNPKKEVRGIWLFHIRFFLDRPIIFNRNTLPIIV
jgi:hypothetical protein